jgi:hypothetical protein
MRSRGRFAVVVASAISLLTLVTGCIIFMEPLEEEQYIQLADETVLVSEDVAASITSVTNDGQTLVFGHTSPGDLGYTEGSILVIPPNEQAPSGLLRNVIHVRADGDDAIVTTTPASLEDAVDACHIDYTLSPKDRAASPAASPDAFLPKGEMTEKLVVPPIGLDHVLYEDPNNPENTVKIVGELNLTLTLDFWLDIELFGGLKRIGFTVTIDQSAEVGVEGSLSLSDTYEMELAPIPLGTYVIPGTPIWLQPTITTTVTLDASGQVEFYFGLTESCSYTAGVDYDEGAFETIWIPNDPYDIDTTAEASASCSLRASVTPELIIKVWSLVGPFVNAEAYAELVASVALDQALCWQLFAGLGVHAGIEAEILKFRYETDELIGFHRLVAEAPECNPDEAAPDLSLVCGTSTSDGNVSFTWSATDDSTSAMEIVYQYKLEGFDADWSDWSSETSKSYSSLPDGDYQFCVRAMDGAGNVSSSECCSFTVSSDSCENETDPPLVFLDCGTPTSTGNVTFSWSGFDACSPPIQYQYKLEGTDADWSAWLSVTTKTYVGLLPGTYQFCVRARDEAGNTTGSECCSIIVSDGQPGPCPPPEGVTEFTGRIYQLDDTGSPIAWISDRTHVSGVDITHCYTGPYDVEVYCDSPCVGFVSPNLQVGDEVEVRGYFRDGGTGAWAEIYLNDPSYYLRKSASDCPPHAGNTSFVGQILEIWPVISVNAYVVRVDDCYEGVDLSRCMESVVVYCHKDTCSGTVEPGLGVGDCVVVNGYYDPEDPYSPSPATGGVSLDGPAYWIGRCL